MSHAYISFQVFVMLLRRGGKKKKKGFLDLCQVILARFLITEKFENWTSFYYNLNFFLIN